MKQIKMSSVPALRFLFFMAMVFLSTMVQSQTKTTAKPASKPKASTQSNTLTNKNIIDLQKAGLGDEIILTKIARSKCAFDLSTDGLIDLKSKGVSADVIKAMMNKSESETSGDSSAAATEATKTQVKSSSAGNTNSVSHAVELMNHVYVLQKGDQSVKPLEKSMAGKRTRNYGFKGVQVLQVDGANSGVSLPADDIQYFLINTGGALPELNLYTLKSAKGKREVESMSVGTFEGAKTGEKHQIPVNISKLDNGVYKIVPGKALEKGEYFFTTKPEATATSFDVYTFGVK
jgi:hypothetical protein